MVITFLKADIRRKCNSYPRNFELRYHFFVEAADSKYVAFTDLFSFWTPDRFYGSYWMEIISWISMVSLYTLCECQKTSAWNGLTLCFHYLSRRKSKDLLYLFGKRKLFPRQHLWIAGVKVKLEQQFAKLEQQ